MSANEGTTAPWSFTGVALTHNGNAPFTASAGAVRAVDSATGATLWSRTVASGNEGFHGSAALAGNGVLYFTGDNGYVYALSSNDGTLLWSNLVDDYPQSPAIGPDGTLYVVSCGDYGIYGGTTPARLYAFRD